MIPVYVFSGAFLGTLSAAAVFSGAGGITALMIGYSLFAFAAIATATALWFLGPVLRAAEAAQRRPKRSLTLPARDLP